MENAFVTMLPSNNVSSIVMCHHVTAGVGVGLKALGGWSSSIYAGELAMAYRAVEESELGGGLPPSAPPRRPSQLSTLRSRSGSPPRYDAVLANDPKARQVAAEVRNRGFQESMAHAGKPSTSML